MSYYDPNSTLVGVPAGSYAYDQNATLVAQSSGGYDQNATLVAQSSGGYDPNATLVGAPGSGFDPNSTLVGGDPNSTLVGEGAGPAGMIYTTNTARLQPQQPTIVPHIKMTPTNPFFPVIDCDVPRTLKFGRLQSDTVNDEPDFIGFPSKVVSRRHAEIWTVNNEFYIRDTKSQSGTFLNAMRLSLPSEESKPFKLKNGDSIQFGVDRRGATEDEMKCVAMTIELSFRKVGGPQASARPASGQIPKAQPMAQPMAPSAQLPRGNSSSFGDLTLVKPY